MYLSPFLYLRMDMQKKTRKPTRRGSKPIDPVYLSRDSFLDAAKAGKPPKGTVLHKSFTDGTEIYVGADVPEDRSIKFVISTHAVDRDGDKVDPTGWHLASFMKNPVVCWSHDYFTPPIARATEIKIDGDKLVAVAQFAPPDVHPFAETVYQLLKQGFLTGASVGFKPVKWTYDEERKGFDFSEQELLEFSVVPVPSNAEALLEARGTVNTEPMRQWAIKAMEMFEEPDQPAETKSTEIPDADDDPVTEDDVETKQADDVVDKADVEDGVEQVIVVTDNGDGDMDIEFEIDPEAEKKINDAVEKTDTDVLNTAYLPEESKDAEPEAAAMEQAGTVEEPAAEEKAPESEEKITKPMPSPNAGESRDDFVSRCMGDDGMNEEYPDQSQRAAVCHSIWDDRKDVDPEVVIEKRGRVLAKRNEDRLRKAAELLNDALKELDTVEADAEEEKETETGIVEKYVIELTENDEVVVDGEPIDESQWLDEGELEAIKEAMREHFGHMKQEMDRRIRKTVTALTGRVV
jgi:HK97 family phage prohead protease